MEIRQLEAFLVVAEELHFGRAADRLHIAQPALSRTIRALERELDTELFERTTRRVKLTSSGEALLGPAQAIQVQADGVRRIAKSAQEGDIANLKVGFAGAAGYATVSQLIREVSRREPGITLKLIPRTFTGDSVTALHEGELDLSVITLPAPPGISAHLVSNEDVLLAVPADHRLARQTHVEMTQLRNEGFISYPAAHGSRVRDAMLGLCSAAGFTPFITQEAPDPYSTLALVGAGVGVSVIVGTTRNIQMKGVAYLPIMDTDLTLPIALGWRDSNPSLALRRVVKIAQEVFESNSREAQSTLSTELPSLSSGQDGRTVS